MNTYPDDEKSQASKFCAAKTKDITYYMSLHKKGGDKEFNWK